MDIQDILKALTPKEGGYLETLLSNPISRITANSNIELTAEEICEALNKAKVDKGRRLQYEENEQRRRDKGKELMQPFSPDELIEFCRRFYYKRFERHFEIDEQNKLLVEILAKYFTNTESEGQYDLNKGILIMGSVGTGKTELLRFFQKNKKTCFRIVSCNNIADEYPLHPDECLENYSSPFEKPLHDPDVFFQKFIGCCFDDLGTEEIKNNFGNKKDVMTDIILSVYNKKQFSKFHVTTNLNAEGLTDRYGTRVASRLREMFNVFVLNGTDRRK